MRSRFSWCLFVALIVIAGAPATAWASHPPVIEKPPEIVGNPTVGLTITATRGFWLGGVDQVTYQWENCSGISEGACLPIPGATTASYVPLAEEVSERLRMKVTATDVCSCTTVAYSAESEPIAVSAASFAEGWGNNYPGAEVGTGYTTSQGGIISPQPLSELHNITQIVTSNESSYAVVAESGTTNGKSWGSSGSDDLGDGLEAGEGPAPLKEAIQEGQECKPEPSAEPTCKLVQPMTKVTQMACGFGFTTCMAIVNEGGPHDRIMTWGAGGVGERGCGEFHSPGTNENSKKAECAPWFVAFSVPCLAGHHFTEIATGGQTDYALEEVESAARRTVCGLEVEGKQVLWTWGKVIEGRAGNGQKYSGEPTLKQEEETCPAGASAHEREHCGVKLCSEAGPSTCAVTPIPVTLPAQMKSENGGKGATIVGITTGKETTHVLLSTGRVLGWGNNTFGEVGNDETEGVVYSPEYVCGPSATATCQSGPYLEGAKEISSGDYSTTAVLGGAEEGEAMSWGEDRANSLAHLVPTATVEGKPIKGEAHEATARVKEKSRFMTGVTSFTAVQPGSSITGPGVPAGTTVWKVSAEEKEKGELQMTKDATSEPGKAELYKFEAVTGKLTEVKYTGGLPAGLTEGTELTGPDLPLGTYVAKQTAHEREVHELVLSDEPTAEPGKKETYTGTESCRGQSPVVSECEAIPAKVKYENPTSHSFEALKHILQLSDGSQMALALVEQEGTHVVYTWGNNEKATLGLGESGFLSSAGKETNKCVEDIDGPEEAYKTEEKKHKEFEEEPLRTNKEVEGCGHLSGPGKSYAEDEAEGTRIMGEHGCGWKTDLTHANAHREFRFCEKWPTLIPGLVGNIARLEATRTADLLKESPGHSFALFRTGEPPTSLFEASSTLLEGEPVLNVNWRVTSEPLETYAIRWKGEVQKGEEPGYPRFEEIEALQGEIKVAKREIGECEGFLAEASGGQAQKCGKERAEAESKKECPEVKSVPVCPLVPEANDKAEETRLKGLIGTKTTEHTWEDELTTKLEEEEAEYPNGESFKVKTQCGGVTHTPALWCYGPITSVKHKLVNVPIKAGRLYGITLTVGSGATSYQMSTHVKAE